ncbi:PREDICTED: uncharacterized protein LOC105462759 isoform X1 [Wasmannia auropunctata]|uniref:uncharacterized protein LOC105462759 isoform X1 n=2 Tax=Wasmannia auropunctata TaxID=64793 RepID=UPI0005EF90A9|nr:PREDICTED: uncharacterized protein LOC105462759 isoform X1 [Wasmannia auropunctata]
MRFSNKNLFKPPYILEKCEFRKILMTNLGLTSFTSSDVDNYFNTKRNNLVRHRVIKNCSMCKKYNVKVDSLDSLFRCLRSVSYTLEHRINVLKDIGVPVINTSQLNKIFFYIHKKVSNFKVKTNIPAEQNIAMNIFGGEFSDDISKLGLNDNLTVEEYYQKCLLYCKSRIFNLPYLDDKIFLDNKNLKKVKSISMIAETLKVLRLDLGYDEKMIKRQPKVIIASADNIRLLLNSFTDIVGIPIVDALREYPFILLQDVDNVKQLVKLFKLYEIPNEYVKSYMKVFTIRNEVFQERIEMIKRHPNLNVWYKHSRIVQIASQIHMTKNRLQYVSIMDSSKWVHPNALLSQKHSLDKAVQIGLCSHKRYVQHVLKQELEVDMSDLLTRHPHWKTAAFADIVQMIKYLRKHFTIDEICPNIHIVLYKRSRVQKVLADLKQQYSQSTEYSFTDSQYLALCLYMLEKDNHFTGDGIWSNERDTKQQSLKKRNIVEISDNSTSTVENINDNFSMEDDDGTDHNDIDAKGVALSNNT